MESTNDTQNIIHVPKDIWRMITRSLAVHDYLEQRNQELTEEVNLLKDQLERLVRINNNNRARGHGYDHILGDYNHNHNHNNYNDVYRPQRLRLRNPHRRYDWDQRNGHFNDFGIDNRRVFPNATDLHQYRDLYDRNN